MKTVKPASSNSRKTETKSIRLYHRVAVLSVMAGAGVSVGFTVFTGRYNSSVLLIVLFVGWVLSPYIALLLFNAVATRWSVLKRLALHSLMILITLGSLVLYCGLWQVPGAKPAFVFLIVPLLSWFLMGTAVLVATSLPNKS